MHISAFIYSDHASRRATDCRTRVSAFSVLRLVPASLYKRRETCGVDWNYRARETGVFLTSCDSMLIASKPLADFPAWDTRRNPCGPNPVDRTRFDPSGIANPLGVRKARQTVGSQCPVMRL